MGTATLSISDTVGSGIGVCHLAAVSAAACTVSKPQRNCGVRHDAPGRSLAILPVFWLLVLVQHELVDAYRTFTAYLSQGPHSLPAVIRDLPWVGARLQESLDRYSADPAALERAVPGWFQRWGGQLAALLGDVGRNLAKIFVSVLTLSSSIATGMNS